jgi:hypothetical protein
MRKRVRRFVKEQITGPAMYSGPFIKEYTGLSAVDAVDRILEIVRSYGADKITLGIAVSGKKLRENEYRWNDDVDNVETGEMQLNCTDSSCAEVYDVVVFFYGSGAIEYLCSSSHFNVYVQDISEDAEEEAYVLWVDAADGMSLMMP